MYFSIPQLIFFSLKRYLPLLVKKPVFWSTKFQLAHDCLSPMYNSNLNGARIHITLKQRYNKDFSGSSILNYIPFSKETYIKIIKPKKINVTKPIENNFSISQMRFVIPNCFLPILSRVCIQK
jgi:hypothetical protein